MSKKIVRLTESDLIRLVKKVVKEQYNDDEVEFNSITRNRAGDLEHEHSDSMILLKGKSSRQVQRVLSNLSQKIKFIAIIDCESADFSDVDLCSLPKLMYVTIKDTPNNLEEVVDCDYKRMGDWGYDFQKD